MDEKTANEMLTVLEAIRDDQAATMRTVIKLQQKILDALTPPVTAPPPMPTVPPPTPF